MAKLRPGAGFGALSGKTGNAVFATTAGGVVLRERPGRAGPATEAQGEARRTLARANVAWRGLSPAQAESWRAFARRNAFRDPATGLMRVPAAPHLFVGLAAKYLQVHGGFSVPLEPPEGVFLGDVLDVSVEADGPNLRFEASGANRSGVLTELLAQRLTGPHNTTRPRSYKSLAFVSFEGPGDPALAPVWPGTWAAAVRFVESASGRATHLIEIGRATVTAWP
jgi:hypothetical protein